MSVVQTVSSISIISSNFIDMKFQIYEKLIPSQQLEDFELFRSGLLDSIHPSGLNENIKETRQYLVL